MDRKTYCVLLVGLVVFLMAVVWYVLRGTPEERYRRIADVLLVDNSEGAFQRFLEILPRRGEYYVFEGDLLYTADEVRSEVDARRETWAELQESGSLQVHEGAVPLQIALDTYLTARRRTKHGPLDVWPPNERTLTYAIDIRSFRGRPDDLTLVRDGMEKAAEDWEALCGNCGIDFKEVIHPYGESPDPGIVTFVVERDPGAYVAFAFYRSWKVKRRYLQLGTTFFADDVDHVGVLRHEIGHILGYVHENFRSSTASIGICKDDWENPGYYKAITPYDSSSVMHLVCGSAEADSFPISDQDTAGHRQLYNQG